MEQNREEEREPQRKGLFEQKEPKRLISFIAFNDGKEITKAADDREAAIIPRPDVVADK